MSKQIEWDRHKTATLWNYYAGNRSYHSQYFSYHSGDHILDHLVKFSALDGNVLDFGCGPGFLLEKLLRRKTSGKVFGLDFSESSVVFANENNRRHPLFGKVDWVTKLPSSFEPQSMDLIVSVEVMEHLTDSELGEMLLEIHRLLKPKARLVLTTPNGEDLEANKTICPECGCIFHRWQHIRVWDSRTISECLQEHNFNPLVIQALHFQPLKYRVLDWCAGLVKTLVGKRSSLYQPHLFAIAEKRA